MTRTPMNATGRLGHFAWRATALLLVTLLLSSCGWRGLANLSLPGGPGNQPGDYTVYVQMPDTLALNGNSEVLVKDVLVGTVRSIRLTDWVATLTLGIDKAVKLPRNVTAKIGQTSLLGSQHIELAVPEENPSAQLLGSGDVIPLERSSAYPSVEQTLASLALILHGGGIPNLEVLENELFNMVGGRAPQIRALVDKMATFTDLLNQQRADIVRAIDSADRLLSYVSTQSATLERVFTHVTPMIEHFAETQQLLVDATIALGNVSDVTASTLQKARPNLHQELINLQCPLKELEPAAPHLPPALRWLLSIWPVEAAPKAIRGDYINVSLTFDVTYSSIDNALLTGTGLMGVGRALEQAQGRDPRFMIPDVRYTPNPNNAPGGPLVERGDRNC